MDFKVTSLIKGVINLVTGLVIIGLSFRFILRLFDANQNAGFVEFIYDSTDSLLEPFRNIFTPLVIEPGNVLEYSTLMAIVVYSLVAWLLIEFIDYIVYTANTSYRK